MLRGIRQRRLEHHSKRTRIQGLQLRCRCGTNTFWSTSGYTEERSNFPDLTKLIKHALLLVDACLAKILTPLAITIWKKSPTDIPSSDSEYFSCATRMLALMASDHRPAKVSQRISTASRFSGDLVKCFKFEERPTVSDHRHKTFQESTAVFRFIRERRSFSLALRRTASIGGFMI